MIELLTANTPNGKKISIMLEEIKLKYKITKINIDNDADNVIPRQAEATFNVRYNNKHSSNSLKRKLNKIFYKINKKNKSKFKIQYRVSGEAFLTKPNATTFMIQNIVKKITKLKPKLSTTCLLYTSPSPRD